MKKMTLLYLLVTTVVIGFSFLLPDLVVSVAEGKIKSAPARKELKSLQVDLNDNTSLVEKLQLMGTDATRLELDEADKQSREKVHNQAVEALDFLDEKGIDNVRAADYTDHQETHYLLTTPTPDKSLTSWMCNFSDEAGNVISMWIDDETGKMLSVTISNSRIGLTEAGGERIANIEIWGEACADYYGFDLMQIKSLGEDGE